MGRLRVIAAPFVAGAPAGARVRTRLRVSPQDAAVLWAAGSHLGSLAGGDLAARSGTKTGRPHRITAGNQAAQHRTGPPAPQDHLLHARLGTVNIYPREVEDALALHPAVADIVVLGIPDEEMGQRVHAVVQPAVPGTGTPELAGELIDFCRSRIAHYKAPRTIAFEDELPRTPSGKMLRRLIIDRYRQASLP